MLPHGSLRSSLWLGTPDSHSAAIEPSRNCGYFSPPRRTAPATSGASPEEAFFLLPGTHTRIQDSKKQITDQAGPAMSFRSVQKTVAVDHSHRVVVEEHEISGLVQAVERPMTRMGAGDTWQMSAEDRRVFAANMRGARRRARGLLSPEQITALRERHELSQRRASEIFGGGPRSFQKYEQGTVVPSIAINKLLRLVDRYPDLIRDVSGFC